MSVLQRALYRSLLSAAKRLEAQIPRHGKTGVFSEACCVCSLASSSHVCTCNDLSSPSSRPEAPIYRVQEELQSLESICAEAPAALAAFTKGKRPFQALVRASFREPVEPPVRCMIYMALCVARPLAATFIRLPQRLLTCACC